MVICNPSLLQKDTIVFRDSVKVFDTVLVESSAIDTTFANNSDTIIIENDKIRIEYIKKDSIVYLRGTIKSDTVFIEKKIYVERKIPVEKIIVKTPTLAEELGRFGKLFLILLLIATGIYFVIKIIKKYYL